MRHKKAFRKFGRSPSHRKAMFRNLTNSLIEHGKIETTLPKAKDLRRVAEKLITIAGEDTLHRRRQAYGFLPSKQNVHKLFAEIGPKFKERPGGYTRVIRTRQRVGDAAEMAIIELVQEDYKPSKKSKKSKPVAAKAKAPKEEKVEAKTEEAVTEVAADSENAKK